MPLLSNDLISESDLHTIALPADGEWVRVKKRLSRGDEIDLQKRLINVATFSGEIATIREEKQADAFEAMEFMTIEAAIVAWSFDAPVTAANIRALDPDSVEKIKEELNALWPAARTDDERKNLVVPGVRLPGAEVSTPNRSNGLP